MNIESGRIFSEKELAGEMKQKSEHRDLVETPKEKELRVLSEELGRELLKSFPGRDKMEAKISKEQGDLGGRIIDIKELDPDMEEGRASRGSNLPLRITLEGGREAIYKPKEREVDGLRFGIEAGTYAAREWLAFQIDRALQLDLVPTTIVRNGPLGIGAVQCFEKGTAAEILYDWQGIANKKQLEDLALNDLVKGNTDRMENNFLVEAEGRNVGRIHAIDHGLILSKEPSFDGLLSAPMEMVQGQGVSKRIIKKISDFRASDSLPRVLRKMFTAALPPDNMETAWLVFNNGLERLMPERKGEMKRWPDPNRVELIYDYQKSA